MPNKTSKVRLVELQKEAKIKFAILVEALKLI